MKQLAFVVLLCIFCSSSFGNQTSKIYADGKALYADLQLCDRPGAGVAESQFPSSGIEDYGKCKLAHGYIGGITDYMAAYEKPKVCLPLGTNDLQVTEVIFKWLESHPVMMRYSASLLIARAIEEAWPCAGK